MPLESEQEVRDCVRNQLFELLKPNDIGLVQESGGILARYLANRTLSALGLKLAELAPDGFQAAKDDLCSKIDSWQTDFIDIIVERFSQAILDDLAGKLGPTTSKYGTRFKIKHFIDEAIRFNWTVEKNARRICLEVIRNTLWVNVREFISAELIHRLCEILDLGVREGTPLSLEIARDANLVAAIMVRPIPVHLDGVKIVSIHATDYARISETEPISSGIRLFEEVSANVVPEAVYLRRLVAVTWGTPLQNAEQYPPLKSLCELVELVSQGKGPISLKADFDARTTEPISPIPIQLESGIWVSINDRLPTVRRAAYAIYDKIVVCYLAIACIEGLVRTIADSQGIKLWRKTSPVGIEDLLKVLDLGDPLIADQIREVFLKERTNLRNLMAHAALAAEDFQDVEETMNLLIDLVALLDRHQLFKKSDFTWTNQFQPGQADIDFARKLPDELFSTDSEVLLKEFYSQVHALQHSHSQLIKIGVINYIKRPGHELEYYWSTIIIAALAESFFRFAAIKLNEPCLTIRPMSGKNAFEMEWQMLDFQRGLLTPSFNTKLESYLSPGTRTTFQTALGLVVKLRNAALHGAWPELDVGDNYQLTKVFIKFYMTLSEILSMK